MAVVAGIGASLRWDVPGGPAIVLVMAALAGLSLAISSRLRRDSR
jgi:ABC-type Mn2+/Zn2+ transport system permease subunit